MLIVNLKTGEQREAFNVTVDDLQNLGIIIPGDDRFLGNNLAESLNGIAANIYNRGFQNPQGQVKIKIHKRVQQIDVFIFNLIAGIRSLYPSIYFVFEFENLIEQQHAKGMFHDIEAKDYQAVYFKVVQHIGTFNLYNRLELAKIELNGQIFGFNSNFETTQSPRGFLLKAVNSLESWLTVSQFFLPVITIDKGNFKRLFGPSSNTDLSGFLAGSYDVPKGQDYSEVLYQLIRREVVKNTERASYSFHYLYLLNLMSKCRCIHKEIGAVKDISKKLPGYLFHDIKHKWRNCSVPNYVDYLNKVMLLIGEIKARDTFYIYIYALLASNRVDEVLKKNTSDPLIHIKVIAALRKTKNQCDYIYAGIRELAANIIEHSSSKTGFICCRVFRSEDLLSIKGRTADHLKESVRSLISADFYLDVNLLDVSSVGIIESYERTISLKASKIQYADVRNDLHMQLKRIHNSKSLAPFYDNELVSSLHQASRAIVSLGLQIFNKKVQQFKGVFFVSTRNNGSLLQYIKASNDLITSPPASPLFSLGTLYNVIIPTSFEELIFSEQANQPSGGDLDKVPLDYFNYRNPLGINNDKAEFTLVQFEGSLPEDKFEKERCIVKYYIDQLAPLGSSSNLIPVINVIELNLSSSQIIRILASLQFLNDVPSVICYNLNTSLYNEVLDVIISLEATDSDGLWSNDFITLFIIEEEERKLIKKYLTGATNAEYVSFNSTKTSPEISRRMPFFDSKDRPVEFELLIYDGNKSLFEISTKKILEQTVTNGGFKIEDTHFRLGSKIHIDTFYYAERLFQNSYYSNRFAYLLCKRISANLNFLSDKFLEWTLVGYGEYSDLLMSKVTSMLLATFPDKQINFSLVNDVVSMRFLDNSKIYNNIIIVVPISTTFSTSVKIEEFVRKTHPEANPLTEAYNILVVADGDIESDLRRNQFNSPNDICRRFNWKNLGELNNRQITITTNEPIKGDRQQSYFIALLSHWYPIESCPICFFELVDINKPQLEKPLIRTDPTSVTPDLIFGPPKMIPPLNNHDEGVLYFDRFNHQFGHFRINENHYIHFLYRNIFYEKNSSKIIQWLKSISQTLPQGIQDSKKITLITPGHYNSSHFLTQVNAILFKDVATAIKHKAANNFVENFMFFHEKTIAESEFVFYVDDIIGSGKTLRTISDHVKLVRYGRGLDGVFTIVDRTTPTEHSEIILNLNDVQKDGVGYLQGENKLYVCFYKLNVYSIDASHKGCPICDRNDTLKNIEAACLLDAMKLMFHQKLEEHAEKSPLEGYEYKTKYDPFIKDTLNPLTPRFNSELEKDIDDWSNKPFIYERSVIKLLISHKLSSFDYTASENGFFSVENMLKELSSEDQISTLFLGVNADASNVSVRHKEILKKVIREIAIKVITQPPFVLHKPILEATFQYVINELDNFRRSLAISNPIKFEEFLYLKFLLKRSAVLNSNYLLSKSAISFLRTSVYNNENKAADSNYFKLCYYKGLEDKFPSDGDYIKRAIANFEYRIRKLGEFSYFILFLIKELIHGNEAKSIFLERTLNSEEVMPHVNIYDYASNDYYFLWRILKCENVGILLNLQRMHDARLFGSVELDPNKYLATYQSRYFNNSDYRLNALTEFIKESNNEQRDIVESICHMLYLGDILELDRPLKENFYENEGLEHYNKLNEDVKTYLDILARIMDPANLYGINFVFAIEFKRSENTISKENVYTMVYERANNRDIYEQEISTNGFIYKMLHGLSLTEKGSPQTYVGAIRQSNRYIASKDTYFFAEHSIFNKCKYDNGEFEHVGSNECIKNDAATINIIRDAQQILFLRLADISAVNRVDRMDEGQAVISICYSKAEGNKTLSQLFDPEKIRLLLLVKGKILNYLNKQFNNDAFIEVLQDRAMLDHSTSMEHGLEDYFGAIKAIHAKAYDSNEISKNQIAILDFLNETISTHISTSHKILKHDEFDIEAHTETKVTGDFVEMVRLIFEDASLAGIGIPINLGQNFVIEFNSETIQVVDIIYKQVIPELLYNMKKYGLPEGKFWIRSVDDGTLIFGNEIKEISHGNRSRNSYGRHMCNLILTDLCKLHPMEPWIDSNNYTIKVPINAKVNFDNRR